MHIIYELLDAKWTAIHKLSRRDKQFNIPGKKFEKKKNNTIILFQRIFCIIVII
jgi:hypothetical protein